MRVAIICPSNIENAPYIKYYTDVFDSMNEVEYVYITWNRFKLKSKIINNNIYEFDKSSPTNIPNIKKYYHFKLYSNYVEKVLREGKFDFILVFTLQAALFLSRYLLRNYKYKYIFDIRDYSPIYPYFRSRIKKTIKFSATTTISSLGFKGWLPGGYSYTLGHNADKTMINKAINKDFKKVVLKNSKSVNILTIGQLRDISSNSRLILSLNNNLNFNLYFVGYGQASNSLKYISKDFNNVFFKGRYNKKDEAKIVEQFDLINILLPVTPADNTLMSNRFYLSLIHRKPMIVNQESIQAKYVLKYNVGLIIKNNDNIPDKITEYINSFEEALYNLGCSDLLKEIKNDIDIFEFKIKSLLNENNKTTITYATFQK
jgi:hypothetical protein